MKRIYHTWDKWECFPAGFYSNASKSEFKPDQCVQIYVDFLRDSIRIRQGLEQVLLDWVNSCEHHLSNENTSRIVWILQAAVCISTKMPATFFNAAFALLSDQEKDNARQWALTALNKWLIARGEKELSQVEAESKTKGNHY